MESELADGLWLEQRKKRLPWRATLAELLKGLPPDYRTVRDGQTTLAWNDHVWGGLRCQITTVLEAAGQSKHESVVQGVRVLVDPPKRITTLLAMYEWLQEILVGRFGSAYSYRASDEEAKSLWRVGRVTLEHSFQQGVGGWHHVEAYTA